MAICSVFVKWPVERPPSWAGAWPTAVGYHGCPPHRRPDGAEPFFCPHLITRGSVRVEYMPDEAVILGPGDGFNVFPGMPYGYERLTDDTHCYWVRLVGPLVERFVAAMGFTNARRHAPAADPGVVASCFDALLNLAANYGADGDPLTLEHLHRMILGYGYHPEPRADSRPFVEQVRDFMARELDRGLNVEQIGRAFQVSRSTLFLRFKRELGRGPMDVLQEIRAARARQLLRETDMPVREVARQCGFSDPLHFTRDFTRRQGLAPTAFRGRHGGESRAATSLDR
jgi:AraC-like DNA-binding protein